ncbi:MAG: hypothetical protein Q8Q24_02550, partial [bacterium]|nr:hypothetical protein [bacterium]
MQKNKVIVLVILLVSVLTSFFIYNQISLTQITFWDEGGYLWQAYVLRHALLDGGWIGLWNASRQEVYYPFLQSWYYIFTSSFLGFSIESLRLANVFLFIPSTILIWFISNELIPKKTFFKLIPTFLFITSPMIIFFFSNAMKEGSGITLTLLSLWLYFQARKKEKTYLFLLTSLSLLALFFTKYNYGVLVIAAIFAESAISSLRQIGKSKFWQNQLSLFGPLFLGFFFWAFYPYKNFATIWIVLQNKFQVNFNDTTPLGHALYYPTEVAFSYLLNPWLMTLAGFGFLWSF